MLMTYKQNAGLQHAWEIIFAASTNWSVNYHIKNWIALPVVGGGTHGSAALE